MKDGEYVGKSRRLSMPRTEFIDANKLSMIRGRQQDDSKMMDQEAVHLIVIDAKPHYHPDY